MTGSGSTVGDAATTDAWIWTIAIIIQRTMMMMMMVIMLAVVSSTTVLLLVRVATLL